MEIRKLIIILIIFVLNISLVSATHLEVNFSNIIDTFEFDTGTGLTPTSLIVSESASSSVVATFYTGVQADGFVVTMEIFHNGTITQSIIDSFEFDTTQGLVPSALKISNNTYIVVYKGAASDGFAKTIEILNNGSITGTIESFEVEETDLEHPNIFFMQEDRNLVAVTSSQTTVNGILGVGFILDNGSINRTDRFIYNDTQANRADSTNVSRNIALIAYQADIGGDNFGGALETIFILDNGSVNHTIDYEILDATQGDRPSITRVNDDTFAIFYEASGSFGRVSTYNITDEGIIKDRIDSFAYDTTGLIPNALMIGNNAVLNVYVNGLGKGELIALEIKENGSINSSVLANITYEETLSTWQEIINIKDDLYLITYQGVALDGFVKTINISSALVTPPVPPIDNTSPVITLQNPSTNINNSVNNTIPLNITFTVSDDTGIDTICIFSNSSEIFDTQTFNLNENSNFTLAEGEISLSQNFPNLNITCFDNTDPNNNSGTMLLNITLDTVPPIIFTISPLDNSIFDKNTVPSISIKANCTDAPVFRFNITIENETGQVASFESRSPVDNFIVIDETLSISSLASGIYTVNHTCADPHTKGEIADYNVRKQLNLTSIKYVTPSGNEFEIKYLQNSLDIIDFGSSKSISKDRYEFWFNTNETESIFKRTFIFEIISKKPVYYLKDSSYRGHFITGDNFIDFEFDDDKAEYLVTKNAQGNYEIEITTVRTSLSFNSIGDLNIASVTTSFEVFAFEPIINAYPIDVCPINNNLQSTLFFMFMVLLAFIIILIAFVIKNGLIGTIGSILLIILSVFFYACILAVGIVLTALGIFMVSFFIFKGVKNFV